MNARNACASFLLLLVALCCACTAVGRPSVVRLGHGLDVAHPVHRALLSLAEDVRARSGGRLRVEVYPSEQLGSERECLELLQIGSLGLTKVSAAVLENFAPRFRVLSLPYLFRDDAHRFSVLEGAVGRGLLRDAASARLVGLAFYDAGSRSFYTVDRPIDAPADLRGLKIRTQESPTAMALVRQLGAGATPLAWGELYTALQQGVVDGAENNPPSFHLSRHYEVARHYSLDEHTAVPDVVVASGDLWQRLAPEARGWIRESAEASALLQKRLWREATQRALDAVREAGVRVTIPDKAAFRARTSALLTAEAAGPELAALVDEIRGVPAP